MLLLIIFLLLLVGGLETLLHKRNIDRIPIRIHVNGTRGKSSVTRLITAGLRAGGIVTCAKTTGTLARMILPDGSEYPVFRSSQPNVIEQIRIVRKAVSYNAKALVIECMALQPYLQALSERKLVRATHAVITNARADHLEVMGPTETDVAWALAGIIPFGKLLFTAEQRHKNIFEFVTKQRNTQIIPITDQHIQDISKEDLAGFSYLEHAENVAIALSVCKELGVDRKTALSGMWKEAPDPGAMVVYEIDFFGRHIIFINGFAANDPESSERIWNMALDKYPDVQTRIAIFNCRADRPERSLQLGQASAKWRPADRLLLIGSGTYIFARAASKAGLDPRLLYFAEELEEDEIFEAVVALAGSSTLVMGLGNIGGLGLELVQYFCNRSVIRKSV